MSLRRAIISFPSCASLTYSSQALLLQPLGYVSYLHLLPFCCPISLARSGWSYCIDAPCRFLGYSLPSSLIMPV
ncbi:hypothetical protein GGR55DRAFT_667208 [Xylaria sp. FL0064]|nr:hypothetical protein GGR55DRAFT_667208 [Xylaria sp. FL0064]